MFCKRCYGHGRLPHSEDPCPRCNGSKHEDPERPEVKRLVPAALKAFRVEMERVEVYTFLTEEFGLLTGPNQDADIFAALCWAEMEFLNERN